MNFTIKLKGIKTIEKIEGYWKKEDYINLLELLDYPDAKNIPEGELFNMLLMAISDFEPAEAAKIILSYKLSTILNEGQIDNLSYEMLEDKIAEEYPNISLHYPLFNINKLLYDAFNGKFPKTEASIIDIELSFTDNNVNITKEIALRSISELLSENSLLKRLFNEQFDSEEEFKDAEGIIWELKPTGENNYQLISSNYWIKQEDFELEEYTGVLADEIAEN